MENNKELIPSILFDLMEIYDFRSLTPKQQEEVLNYFSPEEFDEMHLGVSRIKSVRKFDPSSAHVKVKSDLLKRFDEKHIQYKNGLSISIQSGAFWRAAATFLFFGGAFMYYFFMQQKKQSSKQLMATIDTIYINKETESPAKIYDTVYIDHESATPVKRRNIYSHLTETESADHTLTALPDYLNVLSVREMDSTPNRQKRNSIKDDSLIKNYSFETL